MQTLIILQFESEKFSPADITSLSRELFAVAAKRLPPSKLYKGAPPELPSLVDTDSVKIDIRQFMPLKIKTKELGMCNVQIGVYPNEVRVWCCSAKGESVFRLKALGKVYAGQQDIMVMPK